MFVRYANGCKSCQMEDGQNAGVPEVPISTWEMTNNGAIRAIAGKIAIVQWDWSVGRKYNRTSHHEPARLAHRSLREVRTAQARASGVASDLDTTWVQERTAHLVLAMRTSRALLEWPLEAQNWRRTG